MPGLSRSTGMEGGYATGDCEDRVERGRQHDCSYSVRLRVEFGGCLKGDNFSHLKAELPLATAPGIIPHSISQDELSVHNSQ